MNCDNNIHLEKINMFNKPSDWTRNDQIHSEARKILTWMPRKTVKWINKEDMSAFEKKKQHPEYETTEGCLERICKTDVQAWWDALKEEQKKRNSLSSKF